MFVNVYEISSPVLSVKVKLNTGGISINFVKFSSEFVCVHSTVLFISAFSWTGSSGWGFCSSGDSCPDEITKK